MGFLDKLKSFFFISPGTTDPVYTIQVRCRRCGEVIESRLQLQNDLSLQEDGTYIVHKTLMGNQRCFERLEVTLTFDKNRHLIDRTVTRGEFIEPPTTEETHQNG